MFAIVFFTSNRPAKTWCWGSIRSCTGRVAKDSTKSRADRHRATRWESVNIEAMPRLARWTFNAFYAAAQLGLTIADCVHFLMPGSPYHEQLLHVLPERLRYEWEELVHARSGEAMRILESSRNRLKPYFESDVLRRMFGATKSRLDVERLMREKKIVILNLAPGNRLSTQLSNAIGALILNEDARHRSITPAWHSLSDVSCAGRVPEFRWAGHRKHFARGPSTGAPTPAVHQGFSQLKRGDYDLTAIVFPGTVAA